MQSANTWFKRGKKYKANTLAALKQLYGAKNADKDGREEEKKLSGTDGTNQVCDVVEKGRISMPSQS